MPDSPAEAGMIADRAIAALKQNCVLTYVDFHRYEGLIRLDAAEQIVDGVSLPADGKWMTKSSLKILPDTWQTPLNKIEGQARNAISHSGGVTFKRGVFIIPVERAGGALETLHRLKGEYHQAAQELCRGYPEILADFERRIRDKFGQEKFPPIWEYLQKKLHTSDEVLRRHSMEVGIWPIGADNAQLLALVEQIKDKRQALLNIGTSEQNRNLSSADSGWMAAFMELDRVLLNTIEATAGSTKFTSTTLAAHLAVARQATDRLMLETIERAFTEPRAELEAAIDHLLHLQAEGSTRLGGAVDGVQRAWSNLESWKWLAPADLAAKMNQVSEGVNKITGFDVSRATELGVRVTNSLKAVRAELTTANADVRFLDLS